jgi:hypothetical protein
MAEDVTSQFSFISAAAAAVCTATYFQYSLGIAVSIAGF